MILTIILIFLFSVLWMQPITPVKIEQPQIKERFLNYDEVPRQLELGTYIYAPIWNERFKDLLFDNNSQYDTGMYFQLNNLYQDNIPYQQFNIEFEDSDQNHHSIQFRLDWDRAEGSYLHVRWSATEHLNVYFLNEYTSQSTSPYIMINCIYNPNTTFSTETRGQYFINTAFQRETVGLIINTTKPSTVNQNLRYYSLRNDYHYVGRYPQTAMLIGVHGIYEQGKNEGKAEGFEEGKQAGISIGEQNATNATNGFLAVFGSIATVPITILNGLTSFAIFDTPVAAILITLLLLVVMLVIIKRMI